MKPNLFDPDFQKWAFGGKSSTIDYFMMEQWNSLHGDKLTLQPSDLIRDSLIKMWDLYLAHQFREAAADPEQNAENELWDNCIGDGLDGDESVAHQGIDKNDDDDCKRHDSVEDMFKYLGI